MIEVWVENETMVEILPPEYANEYLAFTRPDKVKAAMSAAATASARHPKAEFPDTRQPRLRPAAGGPRARIEIAS